MSKGGKNKVRAAQESISWLCVQGMLAHSQLFNSSPPRSVALAELFSHHGPCFPHLLNEWLELDHLIQLCVFPFHFLEKEY